MASIYKRGNVWIASYKDSDGKWRAKSVGRDRGFAQIAANKLESDSLKVSLGFVTPAEVQAKEAASVPVSTHILDYAQHLTSKGNTGKHVDMTTKRIEKLFAGCGINTLADITPDKVSKWLSDQRSLGLSTQTSNYYLTAAKAFSRWATRNQLIPINKLDVLDGLNTRTDRRHDRRALSKEETAWLISTTENGDTFKKMTGAERALVYRLSLETGLRSSEIRSLKTKSFDLTDNPVVTVEASDTKNRKQASIPLRPTLTNMIKEWLARKTPESNAFNMPESTHTSEMIQHDLQAARNKWIEAARSQAEKRERQKSLFLAYDSGDNRYLDFHALRHTYVTNLCQSGVHPRVAQELARHSDIRLTMSRYTHIQQQDMAKALENLPEIQTPNIKIKGKSKAS